MPVSEQDKKVLQIGLAFGLIVALFIGYYYMIWAKADIRSAEARQESYRSEIAGLDKELEEIAMLESRRHEVEQWRAMIEEASQRLPSTPDAEGFLDNLVDILRRSNVINDSVKPEKIEERSIYTEIPWSIACTGQYFEFGPFLNMVELNPHRFMRVKTLTIKNDEKLPGYHPINVNIGTFMFNK